MKKIILFFAACFTLTGFCAAQSQLPDIGGFREEGIASWYGKEFQGRPTASGELFDPSQYTAAHPDLPFGTVLTVTNLANNNQVQVRVNDRGPFVKSRIIDVSQAAAEKLEMLTTGTARVRIESVNRGYSGINQVQQPVAPVAAVTPTAPVTNTPNTPNTQIDNNIGGLADSTVSDINTNDNSDNLDNMTEPSSNWNRTQSAAINDIPENTSPAAQAAQSGRLPTPVQPTIPAANPQQPAAQPTAQRNPPAGTSQQPGTPSVRANNTTPAYTVQEPAVKPSTSPNAAHQANAEQMGTSKPSTAAPAYTPVSPATPQLANPQPTQVRPVAAAPKPPVASPAPGATVMPYSSMAPAIPPSPPITAPNRAATTYEKATIIGGPIKAGKFYRLQIGSFSRAANAVEAFDRLSAAGLSPQWEPYGEKYRVVITSVKAEEIDAMAVKLGAAGFKEALAREER